MIRARSRIARPSDTAAQSTIYGADEDHGAVRTVTPSPRMLKGYGRRDGAGSARVGTRRDRRHVAMRQDLSRLRCALPDIDAVRAYWNANPLLSHEIEGPGSAGYFRALDRVKREDSDRFAMAFWEFDRFAGREVLDVGCGPGWLSVQYASGGARVRAVDLTPKAVELARTHFALRKIAATADVGNAEALPFVDDTFDLVVASGVLHHTPDTRRALAETLRVAKPGGRGKITLYRKGILHAPIVFPITKAVMRAAGVRHPGAEAPTTSDDADAFIRAYDGADNPIGIGMRDAEWAAILRDVGWRIVRQERHFFPRRFLPFGRYVPIWAHRLLDRHFGTMIYFDLRKPAPG